MKKSRVIVLASIATWFAIWLLLNPQELWLGMLVAFMWMVIFILIIVASK